MMVHDLKLQIIFERLIQVKLQDSNCQKIKHNRLPKNHCKNVVELILNPIMLLGLRINLTCF